jgi:hypothetical protein
MTSASLSSQSASLRRCLPGILIALFTVTIASSAEEPIKATICQLKNHPPRDVCTIAAWGSYQLWLKSNR